jgi:hypothetical protein
MKIKIYAAKIEMPKAIHSALKIDLSFIVFW